MTDAQKRTPGLTRAAESFGTVLIADDEALICSVGKRMLTRLGYDVLVATDGQEATDLFAKHVDKIRCVLLDLTMPYLNGTQTFQALREISPAVKVILCSGYGEDEATEHFEGSRPAGFLQKPYTLTDLRETLAMVLGQG